MRLKHGGPFPRAGIELFHLEPIAEAWRIAWSYVNEIEDRGCPRFRSLAMTVDRVLEMPVVAEAESAGLVVVPRFPHLKAFLNEVADKKGYGDNVLNDYVATLPDGEQKEELTVVATWSKRVNAYVSSDCPYIAPFESAIEGIKLAARQGVDCMIVSGTPEEHLRETWNQHGLTGSIRGVFGRESGKKDAHLTAAMQAARDALGRVYDTAIMFGDAPGDNVARLRASEVIGVRIGFMPIRVGHEGEDWQWFTDTFLGPGKVSEYTEAVEAERLQVFEENLKRPWNPEADVTQLF
jgi:phosphoglycolate phosphatase-like HAD superfamily hydrolase